MAVTDALQAETADVLSRLVRFKTVNPPGAERECQEWLAGYLTDAGVEVELAGADPERPNLVARLRGEEPGPVLGYLSHVDTVLADPEDWSTDPWGAEVRDGHLYGRGALDMKSQTAAEAVAVAHLAREGRRPRKGEVRLIAVVDEEAGGGMGAQWLCEHRPDLARCDFLLNEGAGPVFSLGERRLYGVSCAEKGTCRFTVRAHGRAGHASTPALADNALLKLAPVLETLAGARTPSEPTDVPLALLEALAPNGASDPEAAMDRLREADPRLAGLVDAMLGVTLAPTRIFASEKINVIPARAELQVDCRMPPGMPAEAVLERVRALLGDEDGLEIDVLEQVVGNASPTRSALMDAIAGWMGEADPGAEVVPTMLPAFTDSRWFRGAFPECVAYGFFPQRHQGLFETWPLVHGADERIDVRDLGFAASFFTDLPGRLLA